MTDDTADEGLAAEAPPADAAAADPLAADVPGADALPADAAAADPPAEAAAGVPADRPFRRVAVLGIGLVGGSLARLLRERGVEVVGHGHRAQTVAAAREAGLDATTSLAEAITGADLVILAVPLWAMRATANEVARHLALTDDATIIDVGSVKGPVRQAVEAAGLGERFVAAHPMAGNEHSGFAASSAALLDHAPWAVTLPEAPAGPAAGRGGAAEAATAAPATPGGLRTPRATTAAPGTPGVVDHRRLERVLRLITGTLAGTVSVLTDEVHDEAAALISHVPHVVATQLLNAVAGAPVRDAALRLAAGSFRDGTRVAFTDPHRTEAMVTENAAWVAPVLRKTIRDLEALVAALETNAPVHDFFHRADAVREQGRPSERGPLTPEPPVPLTGDWPTALLTRCTNGAVVVATTPTEAHLSR